MRERHGTPDQFLEALEKAFIDGMITFDEARRANDRYRREYDDAPEHTVVDQ